MLKRPELFSLGFHVTHFPLAEEVRRFVEQENWQAVDSKFHEFLSPGGALFETLRQYHDFESVEFIISIRDANNDWEEDGIWHDDGSRVFAFSLSLTPDHSNLTGGRLGIRRKGEENFYSLPTPEFGGLILFLTGVYGFEHKIHRVSSGKRIIVAGWCS